jgi:hypothetical protein
MSSTFAARGVFVMPDWQKHKFDKGNSTHFDADKSNKNALSWKNVNRSKR